MQGLAILQLFPMVFLHLGQLPLVGVLLFAYLFPVMLGIRGLHVPL